MSARLAAGLIIAACLFAAKARAQGAPPESGGGVSASTPSEFPDGSESAPSVTNVGDTNTGLYWPGADEVGISIGGTRRFYLTTSTLTLTVQGVFPTGSAGTPSLLLGASGPGLYSGGFAAGDIAMMITGGTRFAFGSGDFRPGSHNGYTLGTNATRWSHIYGVLGSYSGVLSATAGVNVGGGTQVNYFVSGTGPLDFADKAGVYGCEELTLTCNGAATTNTPSCDVGAAGAVAGGTVTCRVSAANTCALQYCGTGNPASQTYRATVTGY